MNQKKLLPKINVEIEIDIPSNIDFDFDSFNIPAVSVVQAFSTPEDAIRAFQELRSLILKKLDMDSVDN